MLSTIRFTPVIFWLLCSGVLFAGIGAGAQDLDKMQQQFLRGNYAEVITTSQKELADNGYLSDWRLLLVKSLLALGRYDEAYTNAMQGLNNYSGTIEMHLLARQAALFQNDPSGANLQLTEINELLQQNSPVTQDPDQLVALGQALLLLGVEPKLVLENCFQQAEKLEPAPREAFLAAGQLALDKHDFKMAADAFRSGLEKFPDNPDMECGLAQAYETSDREEMLKALEAALAVNPRHIQSLLLLADHLIDGEQYNEAEKQLALVLQVNPHLPEALAYRAVLANLRNDPAAEKQFRAAALKFWQTNPEVDYLIGYKLSQKYRFAEGAAAQRRALEFDPDYLPAREQLAEDLLRLGQSDEGWKLAEEVHKQDGYDVAAFNLVALHDQMEKFQTLTNAHFVVHMSPLEAGLYGDLVLAMLSREREIMTRKYGVELTQPTVVDIFPEEKDFGVRTFGMPDNPGYLGVCFGSVITANSPASQEPNPANWEDVLWHEFTHVITLTASKNKMPRWFSEGISVYEERQANHAWGERMNLGYRNMILNGELTPLGKLSSAFLAPKDSQHLLFAYYESSLVIDFIVERFGLESLKQILTDLGNGENINIAIPAHTMPLPEMEKQFAAYATGLANNLAPGINLDKPPERGSGIDATLWEETHPDNYYLRLQNAKKLLEAKNWTDAKPLLASLATAYHDEKGAENPLWLLAVAERHLNETNAELATLQQFARQESDFVDLYVRLIELSEAQLDWPKVTKYANHLLAINPLISPPYRALAEAGLASGQYDQAVTAYRKLLLLDPPDPVDVHFQLARLLHMRGDSEDEARRQVLQALEDAPRFRDAQRLLLEIEDKLPQPTTSPATSNLLVNP
ncbi:MAG: tetratricopeptide repeat protein [Verrucomicrobiota bacterium]